MIVYGCSEHGTKSVSSSMHSNSNTGSPVSSSPVNVKVAVVSVVSDSGPESIEVSGTDTSTTLKLLTAGVGSTLSASSTARTSTRWSPAVRTSISSGDSQDSNTAPSIEHSNSSSSSGSV